MGNVQKAYSSFQRYVDVLSDSGFKAVFGDEANRDIIIGFLNSVLPEGCLVRSLSFTRTEVPGFTAANKAVRLDLRCESESGRHFIVEMQSSWQRSLFRACEIAGFDREKRIKYERDMISERDYLNIMDSAEERGMEKGRIEGRAEGEAKGRAEGMSRGVAQVASEMKRLGISEELISKASGLSYSEIQAL